MEILATVMLARIIMWDIPHNPDVDMHLWEIECSGKVYQIEHYMKPNPELTCMMIEQVEAANAEWDLPILKDRKKWKSN